MKIKDIVSYLETFAPLSFQESYDNSGLIIGDRDQEVSSTLITLDITEEIIDEAIEKGANLIISHHPIIFSGLKKITGRNYVERTVIKAIQNNIALYSGHTNFDSVIGGVNSKICEKLQLKNCRVLAPVQNQLRKLVTYVPLEHVGKVRYALFNAGAGHIGEYDQCSFNSEGQGTFRASENATPYIGEKGKLHFEDEVKVETVFPKHLESKIINDLLDAHPYEEVAYDIYSLDNECENAGMGMVGELEEAIEELTFLNKVKLVFNAQSVKYTILRDKKIKRVAVCGGSGSFLIKKAMAAQADIFITGDIKYHQFFEAEGKIVIADIGHYESEQFTKDMFYDILTKKFPKFAFHLSEIKSNPINYL